MVRNAILARKVEMAARTIVTLEDDVDGSPADETLRFGLGPAAYEIGPERCERQQVPRAARAVHRARPQAWAASALSGRAITGSSSQ